MVLATSEGKVRYKDGTPAQLGDHVRGTGYNVRGSDRRLAVISGVVVAIQSENPTSNVTVAHCVPSGQPGLLARVDVEYGQADHFERI